MVRPGRGRLVAAFGGHFLAPPLAMSDGFRRPAARVPSPVCVFLLFAVLRMLSPQLGPGVAVAAAAAGAASSCQQNDTCTLLEFKNGLPTPVVLRNWTGPNATSWKWVKWWQPDASGALFARALDLSGLPLNGTSLGTLLQGGLTKLQLLNLSEAGFAGPLNETLRICPALQALDLHGNQFTGPIPRLVGCDGTSSGPINLQVLNLGQNNLTDVVPASLFAAAPSAQTGGSLRNLSELYLDSNSLAGSIPSSIGNCPNLKILTLQNNSLTGTIPESLGNLSNLETLELSNNNLTGTVPERLGMLANLEILELSNNNLTGTIPERLGMLANLETLALSNNNLTGTIPENLGKLANLVTLELSHNNLIGAVPSTLFSGVPSAQTGGGLRNLSELHLEFNNFSGFIPSSIGNCTYLKTLMLQNNSLTGTIPESLGNLANLKTLELSYNFLSRTIPQSLGNLTNLETLSLKCNNLNGTIPSSLARLSNLLILMLQNNDLTGSIPPELSALDNLVTLSLHHNKLRGHILPELANCTKLRSVWLSDNSLNGNIPPELGNLTSLVVLSISGNYYKTTIPPELGNLVNLVVFDVSYGQMRGAIPDSLCNCKNLQVLFLDYNSLSGSIPDCFGNFSYMRLLDLSVNMLTGALPGNVTNLSSKLLSLNSSTPQELSSATYIQELQGQNLRLIYQFSSSPVALNFQSNQLAGLIPPSFGAIEEMQQLILSNNSLSGPIPPALGYALHLYVLDLSDNALSGEIPSSLTQLTFLSQLNLSRNNLSGGIPEGGQFGTFDSKSFLGNPLLCGRPLTANCSVGGAPAAPPSVKHESLARKLLPLYIILASAGVCVCFLVGMVAWSRTRGCSGRKRSLVSNSGEVADSKEDLPSVCASISCALPPFSYKDLARATENYHQSNVIGDGGFGLVYRAVLNDGDGPVVAVKKLVEDGVQGHGEFLAEVRTLGKICRHRNLVALLGYCTHGRDRILVYEYMKNGCLDTWLHCREEGMESLDWRTRLKVARGAAEGLSFLHHEVKPPIIHRDIKTSNILLDREFEAHLSDFGLARSMKASDTHVSTDCAGTAGYIPPEYSQLSVATTRGDVYSFGVVLLELLTGRRPTDPFFRRKEMAHVVSWMLDVTTEEALAKTLDTTFAASTDEMLELMRIACLCCQETASKRPNMQEVVRMLESLERQQGPSRSPSVVLYEDSMSSPRCR